MTEEEFYDEFTTATMQSAMEAAKLAEEAARQAEAERQQSQGQS